MTPSYLALCCLLQCMLFNDISRGICQSLSKKEIQIKSQPFKCHNSRYKQDLSLDRTACLSAQCPSHKKLKHKNFDSLLTQTRMITPTPGVVQQLFLNFIWGSYKLHLQNMKKIIKAILLQRFQRLQGKQGRSR